MDKPYNECGKTAKIGRETAAQELLQFASRLAERADRISARVEDKLQLVMIPDSPCPPPCELSKEDRKYPPLFDELRNRLQVIENSLSNIEACITRTEL